MTDLELITKTSRRTTTTINSQLLTILEDVVATTITMTTRSPGTTTTILRKKMILEVLPIRNPTRILEITNLEISRIIKKIKGASTMAI